MNKIIKKLHKTLFSLACMSFAISIFSFSAGANVMAERDLLLNSSFVSSDHILSAISISTAAILSAERKPGFFVHFDSSARLHNLGKNIHSGAFLYQVFNQSDFPKTFRAQYGGYTKFNFTNNFYLGVKWCSAEDIYTLIERCKKIYNNSSTHPINVNQTLIFCGNKISIAENTNLSAELSSGALTNYAEGSSFWALNNHKEYFMLFNLNIGLDFKIEGFNVETRLSDFISVEEKDIDDITKYYIGTPAFTISANTDTSWAFLSFGAKTNLDFEAKNMMGFVQATVKL